jgi:hypothetical protein
MNLLKIGKGKRKLDNYLIWLMYVLNSKQLGFNHKFSFLMFVIWEPSKILSILFPNVKLFVQKCFKIVCFLHQNIEAILFKSKFDL